MNIKTQEKHCYDYEREEEKGGPLNWICCLYAWTFLGLGILLFEKIPNLLSRDKKRKEPPKEVLFSYVLFVY
jgi:hypothetical protein